MRVFVLLFNAGTENEGIHTIRTGDRNLVLMFEKEDDATRYAGLLEAQDFPAPTVEAVLREEIEEFCRNATLQDGSEYDCKFVPADIIPQTDAERLLLIPPEVNLEETDWQLNAPELAEPTPENPMSATELERIRRKLEGLL